MLRRCSEADRNSDLEKEAGRQVRWPANHRRAACCLFARKDRSHGHRFESIELTAAAVHSFSIRLADQSKVRTRPFYLTLLLPPRSHLLPTPPAHSAELGRPLHRSLLTASYTYGTPDRKSPSLQSDTFLAISATDIELSIHRTGPHIHPVDHQRAASSHHLGSSSTRSEQASLVQ